MTTLDHPVDKLDDGTVFRNASVTLASMANLHPHLYGAKLVAANAWAHEAVKRLDALMENHYPPEDEEPEMAEELAFSRVHVKTLLDLMAKGSTCKVRELVTAPGMYEVRVKETGGYTKVYSFHLADVDTTDPPQEKEPTEPAPSEEQNELRRAMATLLGVEPSEVVGVQPTEYVVAVTPTGETAGTWHRVRITDGRCG